MSQAGSFVFLFLMILNVDLLAATQRNEQFHHVFSLPDNWEMIDQSIVLSRTKPQSRFLSRYLNTFREAYQQKAEKPFSYPYFLVRHYSGKGLSAKDLAREIRKEMKSKIVSAKINRTSILAMEDKSINVDVSGSCVIVPVRFDLPTIGTLRSLIVYYPGQHGVQEFVFYAIADKFGEVIDDFLTIIRSFTYLPGFEPLNEARLKKASRDLSRQYVYYCSFGALLFLFVLFTVLGTLRLRGRDGR